MFIARQLLGFTLATAALFAADLPTLRFDMGSETSSVEKGFQRVTATAAYNAKNGYGWESTKQAAFDIPKPPEDPRWKMPTAQAIPAGFLLFREHNDITRDGVASKDDLVFRADVPNGVYRVQLTLGDLRTPVCSMQVYINDALVAADVDAKHWVQRKSADMQYGFVRKVRSTVTVKDGRLRIRIHGDDSGFRARLVAEHKKPMPQSFLTGGPVGFKKPEQPDPAKWGLPFRDSPLVWVYQDIGGPFTVNSVNAIEIYPYVEPPLVKREGKLASTSSDPALRAAVDQFNAGRFPEAEKLFDKVRDDFSRALGYLWLAGHPDYEEDPRLMDKALPVLKKLAAQRPNDRMLAEFVDQSQRMERAIHHFYHRADELQTYTELLNISGEVTSMQPEDPLYYKGRIYAGRGLFMIIPHRWTFAAGAGRQMIEEVEKAGFTKNRFVRWYLHDEWFPRDPDWVWPDSSAKKKGAPKWAAEIYEAYNRELDLAEWWFKNRQAPDGGLGGLWGDDVEVLRSYGAFAAICPDASPLSVNGVRKVADGAWGAPTSSIDTDAGYFAEVSDTEHSGEWTADTLVAMIRNDYGNPVYVEHALKTGKLMRDLWMDTNEKGQFLMRSNLLGATGVGPEITSNDTRINFRPASPARMVLWYNNSPTLRALFLKWADAWLAASMSTEKGKPAGIIPQEIGFAKGELGGRQAPTWYEADHSPGTENGDWEGSGGYHDWIVDLFLTAHKTTGDAKYLKPMELEAEYARQHCPKSIMESDTVKRGRNNANLWTPLKEGSKEWIGAHLAPWPAQWESIRRIVFPEQFPTEQAEIRTLADVESLGAEENEWSRKRWPHVTTESIATDRIYFRGMGNATKAMTALGYSGSELLVTYRGLGRDFAAAVLKLNAATLKVVVYNLANEEKQASIVPWLLEPGADYAFKAGPDANNDALMDRAVEQRKEHLAHRGQGFSFRIPGRSQYVLELTRAGAASKDHPATPDLAMSTEDIRYVAEYRRMDVTVHNIGSARVRHAVVVLYEGNKEIGRQTIPNIEAPLDLDPKSVRVGFDVKPQPGQRRFTVEVDPEDKIEEITTVNNRVTVEIPTPLVPKRMHASP